MRRDRQQFWRVRYQLCIELNTNSFIHSSASVVGRSISDDDDLDRDRRTPCSTTAALDRPLPFGAPIPHVVHAARSVSGHHRHAGGDLAARGWQAGAQPDHHWHARVSCIYSRQHLWTSSSTPTPCHVSGRLRPGHVEQYYKTSFRLTTPVLFVVQMHWC